MKIGQIVEAKVYEVHQYGLYLQHDDDLIFIQIPDIDWVKRIPAPRDFTKKGEKFKVLIKGYVKEYKHYLGSIREAEPEKNPWRNPEVFKEGTIHTGTVDMNTDYGSFLIIGEGVHALLLVEEGGGNLELGSRLTVEILSSCPESHKVTIKKKVM